MPRLTDILIFLFANALGFFSAHACFFIGTVMGRIPLAESGGLDPAFVRNLFYSMIITWLICAIFSLCSFFFKGNARLAFLLAPVVIPMAYGLKVLFLA